MSAMTGIPPEIADTIISIIIYFAATSVIVDKVLDNFSRKRKLKKENLKTEKEKEVV